MLTYPDLDLVLQCGRLPRSGPVIGSGVQGETVALWAQLHQRQNDYRMETTDLYPYYHIRDIQPLKDR